MTSRERLLRLFSGQDIDRVPLYLLFPYSPSPVYLDIWNHPAYKTLLPLIYEKTDLMDRLHLDMGFQYNASPAICRRTEQTVQGSESVTRHVISFGDWELARTIRRRENGTKVEPYVSDFSVLDRIIESSYVEPHPQIDIFFQEKERMGERGLVGVAVDNPIGLLHSLCDETQFPLLCYLEKEKVIRFIEAIQQRLERAIRSLLEKDVGDFYWINGSEQVVPPLMGPEFFSLFVTPFEKRTVDFVRSYGKYSMIHCHGRIAKVLDDFVTIGADSLHPVEAPPMGDCPLSHAQDTFGRDTIVVGNLQYGDIWAMDTDELRTHTESIVKQGMSHPFIFSVTGGPSNPNVPDEVLSNYRVVIQAVLENGNY